MSSLTLREKLFAGSILVTVMAAASIAQPVAQQKAAPPDFSSNNVGQGSATGDVDAGAGRAPGAPPQTTSSTWESLGTRSGAFLMTYNFKRGFSLAPRVEYIATTGNSNAVNLLYGPGSGAFSFTVTPTYRRDAFFLRGDLAVVHASSMTPGFGFGTAGQSANQARGVLEAGFMF